MLNKEEVAFIHGFLFPLLLNRALIVYLVLNGGDDSIGINIFIHVAGFSCLHHREYVRVGDILLHLK